MIYVIFFLAFGSCSENKGSQNVENQKDSTYVYIPSEQNSGFSIQIAALRDKKNAEGLNKILRKSELSSYVLSDSTSSGDLFFKIRTGPYSTEHQASQALKNITELGYEGAFIITEAFASDDSAEAAMTEQFPKIQLTQSGQSSHPQWSTKGREIAFFKKENDSEGLYTIGTGGGNISKIIESEEKRTITTKFCWGPSGEKIALVAIERNKNWDQIENLFLIKKNGTGIEKVTDQNGLAYTISDLKWSEDGQKIAFNANYGKKDSWSEFFQTVKIVNLDDPDIYITELAVVERINTLVGWRSNNELLFLAAADDIDAIGYEVWSYEVSTRNRQRVLNHPVVTEFRELAYLPNENLLIYSSATAEKIMTLNLDSGQETLVLETKRDQGQGISCINYS